MALRPRVQRVNLEDSSEAQCALAKFLEGRYTGFFSKMFGGKSGIFGEKSGFVMDNWAHCPTDHLHLCQLNL
jgi:hypothetical protein